jgi:soluble lytic murein transglycosylase-like protein
VLVFVGALVVVLLMGAVARAGTIPAVAQAHRATLVRCARVEWGLGAPVAAFAAQIHQESRWRADARSPVGAQGLAQFMPATARWLPEVAPQTGSPAPWNPGWALRALVAYDLWLHRRVDAATPCDHMAMTLSAYNGGLGWLRRDVHLARERGADPMRWWGHVELHSNRAAWAMRENRGYPRRILRELEPLYEAAGWGRGVCP